MVFTTREWGDYNRAAWLTPMCRFLSSIYTLLSAGSTDCAGAVVLFFQIIIVIFDLSNSDGDGQTFSFEGVRFAGVPVTKTP